MAKTGRVGDQRRFAKKTNQILHIPNRMHAMQTRSITTNITRVAVFETRELLIMIITYLSVEDLVYLRLVSKYWYTLVTTSPEILRKMFLSPEPVRGPAWLFNDRTKQLQPTHAGVDDIPDKCYRSLPSLLNPYIFQHSPKRAGIATRAKVCEPILLRRAPAVEKLKGQKLVHGMFLTQPPVQQVQFYVTFTRRKGISTKGKNKIVTRVKVVRKGGVRFGELLIEVANTAIPWRMGHYDMDIAVRKNGPQSMAWMVGAVFASDEEKAAVEGSAYGW